METEIILVLAILSIAVIMMVIDIVRIDVVAISVMLALGWTGILTPQEMFSGFSSNAVIALMSVMILGRGVARTGIMEVFSKAVLNRAGTSKKKILGMLSLSTGLLSGLIQNIGAAALFLPGILQVSRRAKIPASELIMPMGFAAILGGTLTMVGSGALILVNDLLKNQGLETYNLFSVTPVGLTLLFAGVGFFVLFGRFGASRKAGGEIQKTDQEKLIEKLDIPSNIRLLQVGAGSTLIGETAEKTGFWCTYHINLLAVRKNKEVVYAPWRGTQFEEGQTLALLGSEERINQFSQKYGLKNIETSRGFFEDFNPAVSGFAEIIIPPSSELVGRCIRDYSLRKRYAVEPVVLFNKGKRVDGDISDVEINAGDSLIVYGKWENMTAIKASSDFVVLTKFDAETKDATKVIPAIACFGLAIGLALFGFPISMAFLTGAMCMIFTRVLKIGEAYQAIDWKVVFLLAGLIPLGIAMQKTGAAALVAESIMSHVINLHPIFLVIIVGVLSTLFSLFMSNVGAIVVLAPLVIGMAGIAGIDPRPLVLMAAVSTCNSFLLPTHQVNAFLMSPGGYRNADYLRAGSGLTILFLTIVVTIFYFFYI